MVMEASTSDGGSPEDSYGGLGVINTLDTEAPGMVRNFRNHDIDEDDPVPLEVAQAIDVDPGPIQEVPVDELVWEENVQCGHVLDDPSITVLSFARPNLFEHIASCMEERKQDHVNTTPVSGSTSARKDGKYMSERIPTHRIRVFIGALILNMLHPFRDGLRMQSNASGGDSRLRKPDAFTAHIARYEFRCL